MYVYTYIYIKKKYKIMNKFHNYQCSYIHIYLYT